MRPAVILSDSRRMIEERPPGRAASSGATSPPTSDFSIARLEPVPVSAPAAAFSAARRAAAASVGRAPDSSRSTGQTRVFQSAYRRSHTGEPTSPYANSASGVAPSSDSFWCT